MAADRHAPLLVAWCLLVAPGIAAAGDRPPPCQPATRGELMLVDLEALPGSRDPEQFAVRVTNHSGRLVCRVNAQVRTGGRQRLASCTAESAVGPAGQMTCRFTDGAAAARGGRRRPGGAAPAPRMKATVTGLELAATDAYTAWEARRAAAHSQPASAPRARVGFHHALTITRASDGKAAQHELDRAIGRLRACLLGRARRNPKLTARASLRLSVSRARSDSDDAERLLAVKVLGPPALAPELRDCIRVLDLVVIESGADFVATAEVGYAGDGRPPPEDPEPASTYLPSTPVPRQRGNPGRGRSGMPGRRGF
jgi:hypothetical protein